MFSYLENEALGTVVLARDYAKGESPEGKGLTYSKETRHPSPKPKNGRQIGHRGQGPVRDRGSRNLREVNRGGWAQKGKTDTPVAEVGGRGL